MRYYSTKYGQRSNDFGNFFEMLSMTISILFTCATDDKWLKLHKITTQFNAFLFC